MPTRRYGQIVGNTCVATIDFDPDLTSVEEMTGTLRATLLPLEDYLEGQWGVGATFDGINVHQDTPLVPDSGVLVEQVGILQGQVDDLTLMVLAQTSTNSVVQSGQVTTAATGQATYTWPIAFTAAPRVVASTRVASTGSYATSVEVLAISTTAVTVRAWMLRNAANGVNPAAVLSGASVQIIAYGPVP